MLTDRLYDAAIRYKKTKLWTKLTDADMFDDDDLDDELFGDDDPDDGSVPSFIDLLKDRDFLKAIPDEMLRQMLKDIDFGMYESEIFDNLRAEAKCRGIQKR